MTDQAIPDSLLIQFSPSTFLKERPIIYLYKVLNNGKDESELILETKHEIGSTFFHQNFVQQRQDIVPYPTWYRRKTKKKPFELSVNSRSGRNHVMGGLELLDLGNCHLPNMYVIGNRLLDFVNISDLQITSGLGNSRIKLWFCSALNLAIEGDLAFIDAYKTSFYEVFFLKFQNLKLINGNFQRWSFEDCEVNLSASKQYYNYGNLPAMILMQLLPIVKLRNAVSKAQLEPGLSLQSYL